MQNTDHQSVQLKNLRASFDLARAQGGVLKDRLDTLEREVGEAKYRLFLKDEVDQVIEEIQDRNHQRTVGMYESLLTQICKEVMGHDKKSIALELGTKAGKPALNIKVEKDTGHFESVMNGTGSSMVNVLSAGLRYIALSRIDCRKFMVLDESDCNLPPDRVGLFHNVAAKMGEELGVQSILITHHLPRNFINSASAVYHFDLDRTSNVLRSNQEKAPQIRVEPNEIAAIELIDFMTHKHTVIALGRGTTAIYGGGDIGKSSVVAAIRAISDGDFDADYVRHDCKAGFIRMIFGDGRVLECQRNAKKSPAVIYRLFEPDETEPAHESILKGDIPEWVNGLLGIRTEQGLDVQLGKPKNPIFLLDESPNVRASILSVGGEMSYLATMQEKYKAWVAADKIKIREGEAEVAVLRRRISTIMEVLESEPLLERAQQSHQTLSEGLAGDARLSLVISRVARAGAIAAAAGDIDNISIPDQASIPDTERLARIVASIGKSASLSSLPIPLIDFSEAVIHDDRAIARSVIEIGRAAHYVGIDLHPLDMAEFEIQPVSKLDSLIGKIASVKTIIAKAESLPNVLDVTIGKIFNESALAAVIDRLALKIADGNKTLEARKKSRNEIESVTSEYDALIKRLGGVCPACHGDLNNGHFHTNAK